MTHMRSRAVAYITLTHFTPLATVVAVTGLLAWMIAGHRWLLGSWAG